MNSAKVWTLLAPLAYCLGMLTFVPSGNTVNYINAPVQGKKEEVKKLDLPQKGDKVYPTGLVLPKDAAAQRKLHWHKHGKYIMAGQNKVTADKFDCRDLGWVPPVIDQGNCGSCWDFSGTGIVTSACIKAGYGKNDGSFMLSEQYILDCEGSNGGCDGDWQVTPVKYAQKKGIPTTADYGAYQARRNSCRYQSSMKLYKVDDWGYCSESDQDGVAPVQAIKDAMVKYGPIAVAVAADNAFMNNPAGKVFLGSGSRQINHAVILVGWQDDASIKSGGYWIMRNSWGSKWCENGYIKIAYGANMIGTEAIWCSVKSVLPVNVVVPSVIGDTLGDATAVLKGAGLTVGTLTGDQGQKVTAQSPLPTTTVPTGTAVNLTFGTKPPPDKGTPPFKLYEGSFPNFTQVGTTEGYGTLLAAEIAAKVIATTDKTPVLIYDATPTLIETVQPGGPGPGPGGNIDLTIFNVTPAQQVSLADQLGAVIITRGMTLEEFLDAYTKHKARKKK